MNPFGTPGERAFYDMWATENRRACGCQDERDGVKIKRHPRLRHKSSDDYFWDAMAEINKTEARLRQPPIPPQIKSPFRPMLMDEVFEGHQIVDIG